MLKPLVDLAPHAVHPQLGESYFALGQRLGLSESGVRLIDFDPYQPPGGDA